MSESGLTVKQYAEMRGKSVQAVYRQMKGKENSVSLAGHVHVTKVNNKKTSLLDEEAIRILDEASRKSVLIVEQTNDKKYIEELERENKGLLLKIAELQEALIVEQKDVQRLQQEKMELITANQQSRSEVNEEKKSWWHFWK